MWVCAHIHVCEGDVCSTCVCVCVCVCVHVVGVGVLCTQTDFQTSPNCSTHLSSGVVPNVVRGIRREVWSWLKILQDSTDFGDDALSKFNDRLM